MSVMIYDVIDEMGSMNRIIADEAFVEAAYPGRWELVGPMLEPPAVAPILPPLDARKASLTATVNAHVATLLAAGAPVAAGEATLHVALDDGSRADLTAMATTAIGAASGALPWPASYQQGWITIENIRIPLATPAEGLGLAAGVGDRYAQIRQRGRDLKDAIEAAADDTALDAIDIEGGWPA